MTRVVGTGCMAASVIGAFAAVERDFPLAASAALVCYEIAAELAAEHATGPASFKQQLFDHLYRLDGGAIDRLERIERIS
jgi:hydroxyethylthiazole kinase